MRIIQQLPGREVSPAPVAAVVLMRPQYLAMLVLPPRPE